MLGSATDRANLAVKRALPKAERRLDRQTWDLRRFYPIWVLHARKIRNGRLAITSDLGALRLHFLTVRSNIQISG